MSTTVSVRASKWNSTTPYFQMAGRPCRSEAIDQLSGPPRAAYTCSRDDPILSEPKAPARRNSRIETLTLRGGTLITGDQPDANSHWAHVAVRGPVSSIPRIWRGAEPSVRQTGAFDRCAAPSRPLLPQLAGRCATKRRVFRLVALSDSCNAAIAVRRLQSLNTLLRFDPARHSASA